MIFLVPEALAGVGDRLAAALGRALAAVFEAASPVDRARDTVACGEAAALLPLAAVATRAVATLVLVADAPTLARPFALGAEAAPDFTREPFGSAVPRAGFFAFDADANFTATEAVFGLAPGDVFEAFAPRA
ncbi:MAG TPA: hypothetical protein VEK34_09435 [Methylocella sp.]|nr:hypothetical protein [Methylocella sp.]